MTCLLPSRRFHEMQARSLETPVGFQAVSLANLTGSFLPCLALSLLHLQLHTPHHSICRPIYYIVWCIGPAIKFETKRGLTWRQEPCWIAKDDMPATDKRSCINRRKYVHGIDENSCLVARQSPWLSWQALLSHARPSLHPQYQALLGAGFKNGLVFHLSCLSTNWWRIQMNII